MPSLKNVSVFTSLSLLVVSGALALGCTTETKTDTPDGGTCTAGGVGTLKVDVTGLPAGVAAKVKVTGPSGASELDASKTIADAPGGSYEVSATRVAGTDPIVRAAYEPKVSEATFCVEGKATKTVTVAYSEIASSHKLWLTNANNTTGELQGFAAADLVATGSPASAVAAKAPTGRAIAFDKEGNLWTIGGTVADAPIARFAAGDLGASGDKTPDRKIAYGPSCSPGYTDLAFDPTGNLWITSACAKEVVRLTPAQLAATTPVSADVKVGGLDSPAGLAFDAAGNMWVADQDKKRVLRFDAARLTASSTAAADLVIDPRAPGGGDLAPSSLAFDKDGNLWATSFGGNVIYKLTPSELSAKGEQTVTPSVQITASVTALLEGIAFDEGGGLWLTYENGKVARLAPAQLGTSSGPGAPTVPTTIVSSANIGSAVGLAFYPAPAALPLYAKLP